MASLSFHGVIKRYPQGKGTLQVVHGIDAGIRDGEFVAIVGPSGCGKSTLLRMVAGLEDISDGEIRIGERVVNALEPAERDIAMVFQNYALYPHMSVFDNMAYGLKLRKMPRPEIQARVGKAASILELSALLDRKPGQLSGGQRQRVAMGRALARQPQLFLFDEPLSNLDAKLRVEMRAEIKRLHLASGITSVYVTHDQVEAMTLGSRIAVMKGGVVQQLGTPDDIYNRPANTYVATFIGSPTMNLLRGAATGGQFGIQGAALNLAAPASVNEVLLGVRPEHLVMQDRAPWRGRVSVVEPTGPDTYVMVDTAAGSVTLRTDAQTRVQPGDAVGLAVEPANAHWFDASSENRLA
ncbi:ABC transporter ATP-binding protein [Acidovorax soli]|uniref:ABC transporter ATP-binding protein n=1 Tax=Acidovorax soli TaxID=592050 RepID=UPI0032B22563